MRTLTTDQRLPFCGDHALTIVLLVAHQRPPWIVASHRFVEVSLGIAVALAVAELWRVPVSRVG